MSRSLQILRQAQGKITRPLNVRPYALGELLFVVCLLRLYDLVRVNAEVRKDAAFIAGSDLLRLETWLHIGFERAFNHWTVAHRWANYAASYWYQYTHIAVTMAVLIWCWWWRPVAYRIFRNALLMINLAGLTVFLLLPMAPPRLLPVAGFIDADRIVGFGTNDIGPVSADEYGAFPSLHIAWAVWVAVIGFTLVGNRRIARLWFVYPFVTLTAIMATGNHYLLDAVAGAILTFVALRLASRWTSGTAMATSLPATAADPAGPARR